MSRVHNFSAGPAALPVEVLERARAEMLDYGGTGMSVMEMSHRSKAFIDIAERAEADLIELLKVPADYKVLFLQGGATLQFSMVPLNLLGSASSADYVNTGAWSVQGDQRSAAILCGECGGLFGSERVRSHTRIAPLEARPRAPPICTSVPMRPLAACSFMNCRTSAIARWWWTCLRTFCRGRSMCPAVV